MTIHPNARTTPAIRRELQEAPAEVSTTTLAARYGINIKTAAKWRKAARVEDGSHAPMRPHNSKLTECDKRIICEAKRTLMLPLDDLCEALKGKLSCGSIDRSRVSAVLASAKLTTHTRPKAPVEKKPFKEYPPGYLHVDTTYLPKMGGQSLKAFVAVDRATRMAFVSVSPKKTPKAAEAFIQKVKAEFPVPITHVLTDNGTEFTWKKLAVPVKKPHPFEEAVKAIGAEHRTTKVKHPWTNGRVERLNRTMKDATIEKTRYAGSRELIADLHRWCFEYNHHSRLRTLSGLSPFQALQKHLSSLSLKPESVTT